jgi:hypothetical protein
MTVKRFPTYVFSEDEETGVVAAHNHLALTNPVGSGKLIIVGGVFISQTTTGAVSGVSPMRGYLASNVAGGTLVSASAVAKARSHYSDPVGEVRINGATATLGAAWFNSPQLLTTGAASQPFVHQIPTALPGGEPISLRPGESVALRTESGDTDQRWNISIAWMEAS